MPEIARFFGVIIRMLFHIQTYHLPKVFCANHLMRLNERQIEIIRELMYHQYGKNSRIWLFGSRTDDGLSGGDIDIYLEPERLPSGNLFLAYAKTKRELEKRLRHAVDLVVNNGHTTAFMAMAKREGIPL
jgi:predicted nucleotidyltransferase